MCRYRDAVGLSVQVRAVGAAGGRAGGEPVGLRAQRGSRALHVAPRHALAAARRAAPPSRARPPRLPLLQAVRAHQELAVQEDEVRVAQQRLPREVSLLYIYLSMPILRPF